MPTLRPVDRRILKLAFPALGALAVEPVYILVDTAIVGRIGTQQLAGLAVAASILSIVFAGSNFITYGTTERVANRLGAGDTVGAGNAGVQTMWLSVGVGLTAAVVIGFAARPLARVFGASGAVLEHAVTYLSISAVGIPFILLTLGAQGVLRGESDYTSPLWILLAANVANLLIEIVFVFGLGLGVDGSAWSTVISQVLASAALVKLVWGRLSAAEHRKPNWQRMAPLMNAGRHLLLRVGSMMVVTTGATAVAARIDAPTLAAHQVVTSMFFFLALTLDALAVPAHTIVAEELGGGDRNAAFYVATRSVAMSMYAGVALAAAIGLTAPWLPYLFTDDPAVIAPTTTGLWWLAAIALPGAAAFAYDGALIGAGDYRFLGRAALAYTLAVLPVGWLVLTQPRFGISGIWFGFLVWMLLRAGVNHLRARRVLNPAFRR